MSNGTGNSSAAARRSTLYRLIDTQPSAADLKDALVEYYAENDNFTVEVTDIDKVAAVAIWGVVGKKDQADWCATFKSLTGVNAKVANIASAGAILIGAPGGPYAITYGMGHLLIDPAKIDPGFGLAFSIRSIEPEKIRQITRNILDSRARVDRSTVPGGQPIRGFGIEHYGEVVSRLSGTLGSISMTFNRSTPKRVSIAAADSLKIPLGVKPADLLSDLAEITRITQKSSPVPELGFIDQIRGLKSTNRIVAQLEDKLSNAFTSGSSEPLALTLPAECEEYEHSAHSYRVKVASDRFEVVDDLDISTVLDKVSPLPISDRIDALRAGYIQMCSDTDGREKVSRQVRAHKWLAFEASLNSGHYFYHQGKWFEVGDKYLEFLRARLDEVFSRTASIPLPKWESGWAEEEDYNREAASLIPGAVCLDRKKIHTRQHPYGIEACDIIGPNNELIHVKRASSSGPLSHLFAQGWISIEALRTDREAREKLLKRVRERSATHAYDPSVKPKKLIYGIAIKKDATVSRQNLFTFSQVALMRAINALENADVDVEVIPIPQ
ncbi:DUF6119 family protein [Streptomyces sp. DSM 41972]|uniref:DUF6119 family protein n=1 Tax=Streptomyces althioticus subsp. attaecolombicae TaxID=3075534 RepID=A0ABU3HU43_9ACTN|nr:DUF6119 family protein [Streptomyces sp. DSM 41972]SCD75381.1 sporadically distributed protein, TIGR04141 family [Streptomyces sp. di50b]SCD86058.1 sporadically distributed protein, TIGR04141 family [Streptomyces sp. di188]